MSRLRSSSCAGPAPDRVIVVSGLARCGTSLMMRMLHAGGIEPYCEPDKVGNSYETSRSIALPGRSDWLEECRGKAVKLLGPDRFTPPLSLACDVIWMDRDVREQARSQLKFQAVNRPDADCSARNRRFRMSRLRRERKTCLRLFRRMPRARVHLTRFEDVITDPVAAAVPLVEFLGLDRERGFTAARMAFQVRKREPDCLPYMAEPLMALGYGGDLQI